ncbi:MAG: exonuclease SbcD [Polyangiales bacterium]|jgi:exonuclease SbcD
MFRALHTSDWHLGHMLRSQFDRAPEHDAFLAWLLEQVVLHEADAVLVAGDIYQTSNPPAHAEQRFYDFLARLRARAPETAVVIIAGNHDSASRLEAARGLYGAIGVHVVGALPVGVDVSTAVVRLEGRTGSACVVAVPFLRPSDLSPDLVRKGGLSAGVQERYESTLQVARTTRQTGDALIIMGHGHLLGGRTSEHSERDLVRGNEDALPLQIFGDDFSYAALGHLHLAQAVEGGPAPVHYCGSPIPLSMGEASYPHQVLRVDFDGPDVSDIVPLLVPRSVELIRIGAGDAKPLDETLLALRGYDFGELKEPAFQPMLEVSVFIDAPTPNLNEQVRAAIADKGVRLVRIHPIRAASMETRLGDALVDTDLSDLDPEDVLIKMHQLRHDAPPRDELLSAFRELRAQLEAG